MATRVLDEILRSVPEERESLRPYLERAEAYSNECGCSMGGAFLAGALGLLILYFSLFNAIGRGHRLADALWATVFVFSASIAGKATGVAIARIRLALLIRRLRSRYQLGGV